MGQQQLLLIILAIIVIGVSVAIANQLFGASAEDSNKDRIVSELVYMGTISLQYYVKPAGMAGGGRNFANWQIPTQLDSTPNGTYTILQADNNQLILEGIPIQGSGYTWNVRSTVTKSGIVIEAIS